MAGRVFHRPDWRHDHSYTRQLVYLTAHPHENLSTCQIVGMATRPLVPTILWHRKLLNNMTIHPHDNLYISQLDFVTMSPQDNCPHDNLPTQQLFYMIIHPFEIASLSLRQLVHLTAGSLSSSKDIESLAIPGAFENFDPRD